MNVTKGTTMTMTRRLFIALSLVFALTAVAAPRQGCLIGKDSALLKPLMHPYAASHEEWTAAARVFASVMHACPNGPSDGKSRERLFDYIDGKLSLDYDRLCAVWTKGSAGSGDGCVSEEEHNTLRTYLDTIVDPARDSHRTGTILKHGNGLAISKLGQTVKSRVLDMASTPQAVEPFHDPQIEALRALGLWLLPNENRFTTEEKAQFTTLLLHALPPAEHVAGGRETVMARAVLQALGNSSRPDVAQTLRAWAQMNQSALSYASPLAANAKSAAVAVEKRAQQDR
jgi:hypothetical protein